MKRLAFLIIIAFLLSCKKDLITELENSDIKELYSLKNSNPPTKKLVKSYEIKNTPDTYYLERVQEIGLKFYYDSKSNVIKFDNYYSEFKYKYNALGKPIVKYSRANPSFIEQEFFYNDKNLLINVKENFEWDKSFLRQSNFNYNLEGKLIEYSMRESNTVINNYHSVLFKDKLIISSYNNLKDSVFLNSQKLPVNPYIKYSVKNNIVTIGGTFSYLVVEFDDKNKPTIPNYINLKPYPIYRSLLDAVDILNYSDKNPLKITLFHKKNNSDEFTIEYETVFNYKYDSQNYPIEILRSKTIFNYGQSSTTVKSNQIIKIEYE